MSNLIPLFSLYLGSEDRRFILKGAKASNGGACQNFLRYLCLN